MLLNIFVVLIELPFLFVGEFANFMILYAIKNEPRLHNLTNKLLGCLAIIDMLSIIIEFVPRLMELFNYNLLKTNNIACDLWGCSFQTMLVLSMSMTSVIGFNRYIFVCHNSIYDHIFSKISLSFSMIAILAVTFTLAAIPIFYTEYTTAYSYQSFLKICMIDLSTINHFGAILYLSIYTFFCLIWFSLAIFSYTNIFLKVFYSKRKIAASATSALHQKRPNGDIYKSILTLFALFVIFQLPVFTASILFLIGISSADLIYKTTNITMLIPVVNPIILSWLNKDYKKAYYKLFGLQWESVRVIADNPPQPPRVPINNVVIVNYQACAENRDDNAVAIIEVRPVNQ